VRKYTDAIFLRQSFFNSQVVGALEQLEQRIETLEDEVNTLRAQVKELSKQLSAEKSGQEKKNRP
jgi:chaperonin cofactor prefoldin